MLLFINFRQFICHCLLKIMRILQNLLSRTFFPSGYYSINTVPLLSCFWQEDPILKGGDELPR